MKKSYARWEVEIKGNFSKSPRINEILEAGVNWIAERSAFSALDKKILGGKKRSEVLYDASKNDDIAIALTEALEPFIPDVDVLVREYVPTGGETKGVAVQKAKIATTVEMLQALYPQAEKTLLEQIAKLGFEQGKTMAEVLELAKDAQSE